ncbi:uncharacterized protein N7511_011326 [Penicillium nucicola]|uniref:uncharacterized protein n=1 Tax=Penicillium nucicola TaxID=1850975 RepID=UPI0025457E5E|nr:uncharacterized protein N7511_011326 [Penicillium nucicola]KAJ5742594.1 hypothetical protein N7511_011326 [Penicillium nucicola]
MPTTILPSFAAAFTPRARPIVVLENGVPWLKEIFKRVKQPRQPLNNLKQQTSFLIEKLESESAIWSLSSVMLENTPKRIHIEAYVLYVDMVSQNEMAFKLTEETIDALTKLHEEFQTLDAAEYSLHWPQKQAQLVKLHDEFVEAINKFVYRTNVKALERLEKDGSGELLEGCSFDVEKTILNLLVPLRPPPRVVHFLYPVVPCLYRTEQGLQRTVHLFEEDQWYAESLPISSVDNWFCTGAPASAVEPVYHAPIYNSVTAANADSFGGSFFSLFES